MKLVDKVKRKMDERGVIYDHIKDDGVTYFNRKTTYLKDNYNLTYEEYLGLCISGDKDFRGSCANCGKPTKINNESDGFRKFCGKQCSGSHTNKLRVKRGGHPFLFGNFDEDLRARQLELAHQKTREMAKDGTHPFYHLSEESIKKSRVKTAKIKSEKGINGLQVLSTQIKTAYSDGVNRCNKGGYDKIFLYYSLMSEDSFKIGWTSNLKIRAKQCWGGLPNIHPILEDHPDKILNIEMQIKLKYCTKESRAKYGSTEIFDIKYLPEVLNYVSSSTTIETVVKE